MQYPDFFEQVPKLVLRDPLAAMLGAAHAGVVEYHYLDAVKLAGHSCPTVAGAWLMTGAALAALYPDGLPERGAMRVQMRDMPNVANAGVIGAVIGMVTGAAGEGGFQGLGGRFARRGLLEYGVAMDEDARVSRLDSGASVALSYRPQAVPPDTAMQALMPKAMSGGASETEHAEFARLWQDRVRRILLEPTEGLLQCTTVD